MLGELLNLVISFVAGRCIRYYPLRDRLRFSPRVIIAINAVECAVQCIVFVLLRTHFAEDYRGVQVYKALSGIIVLLIPFVLTRRAFFQNLFLLAMSTNYFIVIVGCANYIELVYGGGFAARDPYFVINAATLFFSVTLLPLLMRFLTRLYRDWTTRGSHVWRFVWIVPALFAVYSLTGGTIIEGDAYVIPPRFIATRLLSFFGLLSTCLVVRYVLRREAENAAFRENARMMDIQLATQRQQYERISEDSSRLIALRHDMRHQAAALGGLLAAGDVESARRYCAEIAGRVAAGGERTFCRNFALNALVAHYVDRAERAGIATTIELDIPERAGCVKDGDLCAVAGNMLENAIEACSRMDSRGEKFISLRSRMMDGTLTIVMDNSFGGALTVRDGTHLSSKRGGEGVGLSSIRAIAEHYGGALKCEVKDGVFLTSVYLVSAMSSQGELC
jgi:Signal transduction histidine kinase regulating citrate/malate metabolism